MFDLVRNHKRWMLFLVLILILPSFVFFGIEGYTRFMEGDQALAKVDGSSITRAEYDMARRNQLDRARQMLGGNFDPLLFDTPQMRQQILDDLIDARVISAATADGHFAVSDNALRQAIAQIPAVQQNGRFDPQLYAQALAAQGLTAAQFENSLRYDLARGLVLEPVLESGSAPQALVQSLMAAMAQERTVRLRSFAVQDFRDGIQVSEADVKQFYDANAQRFHVAETIDAQYLVLDSQAVMKDLSVTDDELTAYYEQNKNRFTNQEARRVSHILIEASADASQAERAEARKQAEALAAQARQDPAQFAELARANSQDAGSADAGGSLGWISRGIMVAPFEDAAFALAPGAVSDVVQTDFGFHVIKVDEVREQSVKPLAEVRDELAEEIRMQKAGERFGDAAGRLTDLVYDNPDSLQPAAEALGLQLQTARGVARDAAPQDAPDVFGDARVRQALFSAEVAREGRNSGVIELAPDRLVALHAERVTPAHTAPLAEVEDEIRQELLAQRALEAAEAAGKKVLAGLQQGEAAEGFGEEQTVSRANRNGLALPVLREVMQVPQEQTLPAYVGAVADDAFVIAQVLKIAAGEPASSDAVKAEAAGLGNALAAAQARAVMQALRARYNVQIEPLAAEVIAEDEGQG